MKKVNFYLFLFLGLLFLNSAYAINNSQSTAQLGENLEKNLFSAVAHQDWKKVDALTAPDFQSINADKIRDRAEALAYIQSLKFSDYQFSDFQVTENNADNLLIVTYKMSYEEKAGDLKQEGKQIKNLSVWKNNNGGWIWVAHAVID